jgi:hypothetical protein
MATAVIQRGLNPPPPDERVSTCPFIVHIYWVHPSSINPIIPFHTFVFQHFQLGVANLWGNLKRMIIVPCVTEKLRQVTTLLWLAHRWKGLRMAMRDRWPLPDEEQFAYTGPNWLLIVLDQCSAEHRDLIKLMLWRAWTVHNNITHSSGPTSITESVFTLLAMFSSLSQIQHDEMQTSNKGKKPYCPPGSSGGHGVVRMSGCEKQEVWEPPSAGWVKINVNGSYMLKLPGKQAPVALLGAVMTRLYSLYGRRYSGVRMRWKRKQDLASKARLDAQWLQDIVIIKSDCARIVNDI